MATSSRDESDSSELSSEAEVVDHFDSFGVPSDIKHRDHIGKVKVWNKYRQLHTMIRVTKYARTKYHTKGKPKEKTHLCLLCLKSINDKTKRTKNSWKVAMCSPSNSSKALEHIKKIHKD